MRFRTVLFTTMASMAAAGCFTVGTPFQVPVVDERHLGRLTQNELLSNTDSNAARLSTTVVRGAKLQCYEFDAYKAGASAMGKGVARTAPPGPRSRMHAGRSAATGASATAQRARPAPYPSLPTSLAPIAFFSGTN